MFIGISYKSIANVS